MLKVDGVTNADLAAHQPDGATYEVEWVSIDQPGLRLRPTPPAASPQR